MDEKKSKTRKSILNLLNERDFKDGTRRLEQSSWKKKERGKEERKGGIGGKVERNEL